MVRSKYIIALVSLVLLVLSFSACANKNFTNAYLAKDNKLMFSTGTKVEFSKQADYKGWFSSCVMDSYTIFDENSNFGKLFVESISLEHNCKWSGLPLSFFEINLKRELKIKYLKTVESIDIGNMSFITYKIDDSYLSLISLYSTNTQKFILDYSGKLYAKLLKSYDTSYDDKFSDKKDLKTYNDSLARKILYIDIFIEKLKG